MSDQATLDEFETEPVTDGGISGTKLCSECREPIGSSAADVCDDCGRDDFDADAETVTDAWEGRAISASYGYGQTNVTMATIVDVSDSGKTVLAQCVVPERVDTTQGQEHVEATDEVYGDEFRLHVRNSGGDPAFRGSYPYIDGEMDSGTRRGSFLPSTGTERRTAPNHGH